MSYVSQKKSILYAFTKLKLAEIEGDDDDYNDDADKSETLEILPFHKIFLIGYIIEFNF